MRGWQRVLFRKLAFRDKLNHGAVKNCSLPKGFHALHGFFKVWFEFEHDFYLFLETASRNAFRLAVCFESINRKSTFDAAAGDTLHEEALSEDEDDQRRDDGDGCARQNQVGRVRGTSAQHVERKGQHVVLLIADVDDDQRPEERVPRI